MKTEVRYFSEAISYDSTNGIFKQELFVSKPTNVTVKLEVSDTVGSIETYEFTVVFRCSDPFTFNYTVPENLAGIAN